MNVHEFQAKEVLKRYGYDFPKEQPWTGRQSG